VLAHGDGWRRIVASSSTVCADLSKQCDEYVRRIRAGGRGVQRTHPQLRVILLKLGLVP
jgi:hypothetical protein